MFKLFVLCIFTLALFQADALVGTTKKPVVQKKVMDGIFEEVNIVRNNVQDTITNIMPDSQNITELVLASSKEFADSVENSAKVIRQQIDNLQGVVQNSIKEFATKIAHSAKKLKQITNNTMEQANKIIAAVKIQVKTIFDDVQVAVRTNILKDEGKLAKATKTFFNDVISAGKRFQLELLSCLTKNKGE